ncbi:hypothetical protein [Carbonactinospora thermoautotrophica]|uniref:hypothetical protein n=1 Tax=Carbonactinospora thermoautotrophica TaxID=1469144 RepID=UPI00226EAAB4|nr:hypothetical protein [Carbonactinospora thermoautotrophica]
MTAVTTQAEYLDLGRRGFSLGDQFVFSNDLYWHDWNDDNDDRGGGRGGDRGDDRGGGRGGDRGDDRGGGRGGDRGDDRGAGGAGGGGHGGDAKDAKGGDAKDAKGGDAKDAKGGDAKSVDTSGVKSEWYRRKIGSGGGVCTVISADRNRRGEFQCVVSYRLSRGQLTLQGLVRPEHDDWYNSLVGAHQNNFNNDHHRFSFVLAITGGTDRYRDASGEAKVTVSDRKHAKVELRIQRRS